MRAAASYSRFVIRTLHGRRPPRVYYNRSLVIAALALAVLAFPRDIGAQIELTVYAAMVKGPAAAPVTIVEFSDYQ